MISLDLSAFARKNLLETYLAVGRTFPGAEIHETDAYLALTSDLPHPSGNFAARLSLDPWSAAELRQIAANRPAFQAVALSGDLPDHLAELLRRAGFENVQRMVCMTAVPQPGVPSIEMVRCETATERRKVGRFMADAFFARETEVLREAMAESIVDAEALTVHAYYLRDRLVAAVTLSGDENIVGIYNLCVAGPHRGKGIGRAVVEWCLVRAAESGRAACLQCLPNLESWYTTQGFVRAGNISVWSLPN